MMHAFTAIMAPHQALWVPATTTYQAKVVGRWKPLVLWDGKERKLIPHVQIQCERPVSGEETLSEPQRDDALLHLWSQPSKRSLSMRISMQLSKKQDYLGTCGETRQNENWWMMWHSLKQCPTVPAHSSPRPLQFLFLTVCTHMVSEDKLLGGIMTRRPKHRNDSLTSDFEPAHVPEVMNSRPPDFQCFPPFWLPPPKRDLQPFRCLTNVQFARTYRGSQTSYSSFFWATYRLIGSSLSSQDFPCKDDGLSAVWVCHDSSEHGFEG